jgi:DNA-binding HxlR family transcriptional regulator
MEVIVAGAAGSVKVGDSVKMGKDIRKVVLARCYGMLLCMSMLEPLPPEQIESCATHPMGRALRLLGDAPTLLIVFTLLHGTRRFGAVRAAMSDVSPKTIAQRLRLLENLGFVERRAYAEIPPRVEYHLTEKGLALADIMAAIREFGTRYLADPLLDSPADVPTDIPSDRSSDAPAPVCDSA